MPLGWRRWRPSGDLSNMSSKTPNLTDNTRLSTTDTQYSDINSEQKGVPVPIVAGEQLVGAIFASRVYRQYEVVDPTQQVGKK